MNWKTMFKSKKDNPFYTKLKEINSREKFVNKIEKAFYLGGFVYIPEGCDLVQLAIAENRLRLFLEEHRYNTQGDNIELYLVEDSSGNSVIVIILDTVELFNKEQVLKVLHQSIFSDDLVAAEQIYP